jgi:hypothetical protein
VVQRQLGSIASALADGRCNRTTTATSTATVVTLVTAAATTTATTPTSIAATIRGKRRERAAKEGEGRHCWTEASGGLCCSPPEAARAVVDPEAALMPNMSSSRSRSLRTSWKVGKGLDYVGLGV